ncbi:MAG: exodeoxyribonuclease VII large subunit [Gammaproteobacteria bacterium CG_4_10_14_0_8_um_filter_38_16]|nr:MAG: exodeoxyribonuclease VII large subunit [Gammaproteobacteria bacterium CG_4_10_14_0_8_um_filter_38_16]PJA02627.1 MAG: exodeoxyribonuclease VII large subunit [Gammaproteobacteria bacterium CG_4_10_14_0_2_um_filter_38_22]PJB11083.1 MAG: exodeoxyribonuclease VII large subunit [Gammaproteobacteria bacterium CG_4_9_14_3_um_filter_38_9]
MKITPELPILSVSELNHSVNTLLSQQYQTVLITGEVSNLSRPASGHLYFSLKDHQAQIRCALFRFQHAQIHFELENGQAIIVRAQVSLYEPRGDFQLIVSDVQLAGAGELQIKFEKLKNELEKRGLFDEQHKKPLPTFPKKIGVITSPSAAALQDIIKVLKKRFVSIPIAVYPTLVQGNQAAIQIVTAIKKANQDKTCDVLILARGGGSIEDLWPFNEANVAQAIFDSQISIITGIGHQTDFTIADFVADVRAPTPSAAAAIASPDSMELLDSLSHCYQRLLQCLRSQLKSNQMQLLHLQKRLQHPGEKLRLQAQQLDQLENQLQRTMQHNLTFYRDKLAHVAQLLENLSPLKVLQRGFSLTRNKKSGELIKSSSAVSVGDEITTYLNEGEIHSVVTS